MSAMSAKAGKRLISWCCWWKTPCYLKST